MAIKSVCLFVVIGVVLTFGVFALGLIGGYGITDCGGRIQWDDVYLQI